MISLRYWLFVNPASHQHSRCSRLSEGYDGCKALFWRDNRGLEVLPPPQKFWKDPKDMEGSHVLQRDFRSVVGPIGGWWNSSDLILSVYIKNNNSGNLCLFACNRNMNTRTHKIQICYLEPGFSIAKHGQILEHSAPSTYYTRTHITPRDSEEGKGGAKPQLFTYTCFKYFSQIQRYIMILDTTQIGTKIHYDSGYNIDRYKDTL